jgi:Mg-chelatase subunit ChlD
VSQDGTEFVQYVWTEDPDGSNGRHVKNVVISKRDGTKYSLILNNKNKTKLVGYDLELRKDDGRVINVSSTLAAINSVAVDYNSSERDPAAVIAYRTDERPKPGENKKVTIVISMVIDDSGSMGYAMNGGYANYSNKARKVIMKARADALIDSFTDNVVLGVVRFASDANYPSALIKLTDESTKLAAKNSIPTNASGGTNTGDGLRRAYYQLKSYVKSSPDEEVLYYIILLTDGNPTYYSHTAGYRKYNYDNIAVAEADYQINNQNIDDRGGTGSSDPCSNSLNYTKTVGERLLRADTELNIRTFVIGFSGVTTDIDKAVTIASNCNTVGTDTSLIYFAADSETALGIAFDTIKESMLSEYWHIYGPYGRPEE